MEEYPVYARPPMRRSSKIILIACGVLAVLLAAVFVPILTANEPEMGPKEAQKMLDDLAHAFVRKNAEAVISFASPDARVAGRKLEEIRDLLKKFFGYAKNLDVQFQNTKYDRKGNTIILDTVAVAGELPPGSKDFTETYYQKQVRFTLHRRTIPHLGGLFNTYEWKITDVDAEGIPDSSGVSL